MRYTNPSYLKKKPKYGNKKVTLDGRKFDSKREAHYYLRYSSDKQHGRIKDFECQPVINTPMGVKYIPDFLIYHNDGSKIYVDVKSPVTQKDKVYRLKRKIVDYFHPTILIQEVF